MYCTTFEGKKSLVRQLSAELHIETDASIVEGLCRFMNKFHLIKTAQNKAEATRLAKSHSEKVLAFRSADSYCQKLAPSLKVADAE